MKTKMDLQLPVAGLRASRFCKKRLKSFTFFFIFTILETYRCAESRDSKCYADAYPICRAANGFVRGLPSVKERLPGTSLIGTMHTYARPFSWRLRCCPCYSS